jgi:hypothetical protein
MVSNRRLVRFTHALCRLSSPGSFGIAEPSLPDAIASCVLKGRHPFPKDAGGPGYKRRGLSLCEYAESATLDHEMRSPEWQIAFRRKTEPRAARPEDVPDE